MISNVTSEKNKMRLQVAGYWRTVGATKQVMLLRWGLGWIVVAYKRTMYGSRPIKDWLKGDTLAQRLLLLRVLVS